MGSGLAILRVLVLAGASVLISLGLAEAVLHLATPPTLGQQPRDFPNWLVYDPVLGFKNAAGLVRPDLTTNTLGLRGSEIDPQPASGVPRIVCLGDSSTFGVWVGIGEGNLQIHTDGGYPEALARLLDDRAIPGEVINAGVAGYSASHGLRQLGVELIPLEPEIIVVRFGLNDHKPPPTPERRVHEPPWPIRELAYPVMRLRLTRLALDAQRLFPLLQFAPSRASVDGEAFRHNLERIAELAEEAGARVLFVDYPLRPLALGEHPHFENIYRGAGETSYAGFHQTHERYQRIVAGVAEARHLPFVDTRARMVSAAQQAYSGADFVHPNDVGAEIIASEVLDAFLELEWLSDPGEQ